MSKFASLVDHLDGIADRYVTLHKVDATRTYDYATRDLFRLPVIKSELHGGKCAIGESWLYIAVPADSSLQALNANDRLYVGAQTQDRMFRGDGLRGTNFHHADMRSGNGDDNPVNFLNSGKAIVIYRFASPRIQEIVCSTPALRELKILSAQPRTSKKHLGWWYEQYILYSEAGRWRWNTRRADAALSRLF